MGPQRGSSSLGVRLRDGGHITTVCDAVQVRRQTYGYLPSFEASPPFH